MKDGSKKSLKEQFLRTDAVLPSQTPTPGHLLRSNTSWITYDARRTLRRLPKRTTLWDGIRSITVLS